MEDQDQAVSAAVVPAAAGSVQKQTLYEQSLETTGETAGTALAAQMRAMVEARFVVALKRPRNLDDVRVQIMRAVERPGFAGSATEKVWGSAWYLKPVGDGVEGFSIRFAEEAARCMGNIDVQTIPVFDDDKRRIVMVIVTDLESNLSYPTAVAFDKTVERKYLQKGQVAIRTRIGAGGRPVYIVEASDDEVFAKQQNLVSKAIRNGILRIVPGDIQGEARTRILAIRGGAAAKDPDGFRKKVLDGFAKLNVKPSDVNYYLGHDVATATPAELTGLRDLWQAIEDGKLTWNEVMEAVRAERDEASDTEGEDLAKKKSGLGSITERLKARAAEGAPPADDQPPATAPEPPSHQAPGQDECPHPDVPEARMKPGGLAPGEELVCKDCGKVWKGPAPEPEKKKSGQQRL